MNNYEPLSSIDGKTLLNMPFEAPKYIISHILPKGLHILAGSPKIGKSWLVLWLCNQIANGENVWNFTTLKGSTLYLCLEDNLRRIQSRLLQITEEGSENTHFATESSDLANGLGIQIENFIKDHTDTSLIVIDTLQRVRYNSGDNYSYANDYEQMNKLKEIADKNNVAIIVVHHLRKMTDNDPINMVSGSTGIVGAVDGVFVLAKDERASNKAKLHITGRDIKDIVILLEFDQEECLWKMISHNYTDIVSNDEPVVSAISQLMQEYPSWEGTSTQLLEVLRKYQDVHLKPNILSRTIRNLSETLFNDFGIKYTFKRTNQIKQISLRRVDSDANDGISI